MKIRRHGSRYGVTPYLSSLMVAAGALGAAMPSAGLADNAIAQTAMPPCFTRVDSMGNFNAAVLKGEGAGSLKTKDEDGYVGNCPLKHTVVLLRPTIFPFQ